MSRIERVSYRSGFVKRLRESRHLPAITFEAADLPEDVVALLDAHLLDLGGPYGDPNAGDPHSVRCSHNEGLDRSECPLLPVESHEDVAIAWLTTREGLRLVTTA